MSDLPTASSIAAFLQDNPDFFQQHAELFAELAVPHPSQARAISLGERQILVLRDRLKGLELRNAALAHQANSNESIARKLNIWCARMLAEPDPEKLPNIITSELSHQFDLNDVVLRFWHHPAAQDEIQTAITDDIKKFAQGLTTPYCGPDKSFAVSAWLASPPASMAIIPLRAEPDAPTLGLMVIGSDLKDRYTEDMATDFLQSIGMLAGSALTRLGHVPECNVPDIA